MSLMPKLLITILALGNLIYATDAQVISFLQKGIGSNPNIISLDISVIEKIKLSKPEGWEAYVIQLNGEAKMGEKTKPISQRSIYFVGDGTITAELYDLATGQKLNSKISPQFKEKYYDSEHLLYGNSDAKHKVVIFSDPLCPFCRTFVPDAVSYMKQYPKTFAVYYYHFPLRSLHPAAVPLVRAAYAAEAQGEKDVVMGLYKVAVDGREPNQQKILDAFNKMNNTKITIQEIMTTKINLQIQHDMDVAQEHLVNGTPTVFFDGEKDATKIKYKTVKVGK